MYRLSSQPNSHENYILVIEDSLIDFEIISRSFKRAGFSPQILHWDNGAGAIEFLLGLADKNQSDRMPTMVLLDLNMQGTDGREILMAMKKDKNLQSIPVIILSTSCNQSDIEYCSQYGAKNFLTKPVSFDDFIKTAKTIKEFWESLPAVRSLL